MTDEKEGEFKYKLKSNKGIMIYFVNKFTTITRATLCSIFVLGNTKKNTKKKKIVFQMPENAET